MATQKVAMIKSKEPSKNAREVFKRFKYMVEQSPDIGYIKVDSHNRPNLDYFMVTDFIAKHAENLKKSKLYKERKHYGDENVDFVQMTKISKNQSELTKMKGRIIVRADLNVEVNLIFNAVGSEIMAVECTSCDIKGLCDHSLAFLFWALRRSGEPKIDRTPYWGTNLPKLLANKPLRKIQQIFNDNCSDEVDDVRENDEENAFLQLFLDKCKENGNIDLPMYRMHRHEDEPFQEIYISYGLEMINSSNGSPTYMKLLNYLQNHINENVVAEIKMCTAVDQYKSRLWHELQFGRMRCSNVHNISKWSKTKDEINFLERNVFGFYRVRNDEQYLNRRKRKRALLSFVSQFLSEDVQPCGLILDADNPFFCASPDGISGEYVVEIKCPTNKETKSKYLLESQTIPEKYYAQIQIQMFLANRYKSYYCVIEEDFQDTGAVSYVIVDLDKIYAKKLMMNCESNWFINVLPSLLKRYH